MSTSRPWALVLALAWAAVCANPAGIHRARGDEQEQVQFNRDIRPLLSDRCFRCHGPDAAHREAGLRLDRRDAALAELEGSRPIVPGKANESEVYRRITSTDADERMPPADSDLVLSSADKELIRRWIDEGANYQPHWAFMPPVAHEPPGVVEAAWPRNSIDRFVLAELEGRGWHPSPEAGRATLLRRASLDLTGLPPTPAELDAFLTDQRPGAYERAVDRLLGSPRYGERMALDWLDAARYADTNGYYTDLERQAWPWRDWVIRAFNANMPFDRFTIEQLAGDLLPGASLEQKIATGFHRNHMVTNESGIIDEEYRVGYVVDRVDTTATVWLGLTVGCARCHDHKYDPISQREYYGLFAFFNTIEETGLVKTLPPANPPPVISLPTVAQETLLAQLRAQRKACDERGQALRPALAKALASWEAKALATLPPAPVEGCVAHFDFDDGAAGHTPASLEASMVGKLAAGAGVKRQALVFDGTQYVEFDVEEPLQQAGSLHHNGPQTGGRRHNEVDRPFALSVWIKPGSSPSGCVLSKMDASGDSRGLEIIWYKAQPRINLVHAWGRDAIEVVAKEKFSGSVWRHLAVSYDGLGKAAGLKVYVDGRLSAVDVRRDHLTGSPATPEPWRIAWKATGVGFEGAIDELRIYDRPLADAEVSAMYWRESLEGTLERPVAARSKQETERLERYYAEHFGSPELRAWLAETDRLRDEETATLKSVLSASVMQEMASPRKTHLLMRGQYDQPSAAVDPHVPAVLGKVVPGTRADRLALARWLVSPDNPLVARVAVNRLWQQVFGEGLVRTTGDFGLQGEPPTHPELLDWLAVHFVRSGWDVKGLLKLLVTSAAYRQSSNFTPALQANDPENRRLARGPRYRLPAELLRDQALFIGGLLVERVGGPSVKPYQPGGLWEAVSYNGEQTYEPDHGQALYRRGIYTYWKRQAPPPSMLTFDGPTREICTVRRARTNTPLQALVLLNDTAYVEAARGLAGRMLCEGGSSTKSRVRHGFRVATGRLPGTSETQALEALYAQERTSFMRAPERALKLLRVGELPIDPSFDPRELAAWTMVANVILNLDEVITQH